VILGFYIAVHIGVHYHFSVFFRVLASGPPTVANGTLQLSLPPG